MTQLIVPDQGFVAPSLAGDNSIAGVTKGARPAPATEAPSGDGVIVALSAIPGFTDSRVLTKPFYFQCPPLNSMPQDYSWAWDDYLTVDSGYHSNPQAAQLSTWNFDTLFMDGAPWWSLIGPVDVLGMCATLRALGDSMTPFLLQFGQPNLWGTWDMVSGATIRALHIEERQGEVDARYVSVSFTEFPDSPLIQPVPPPPHVTSKHSGSGATTPRTRSNVLAVLDSSKLIAGKRTLAELSKYYYGSISAYRLIAKASGLTNTGPNVDLTTTIGRSKPPGKVVIPRRVNTSPTRQTVKNGFGARGA